MLLLERCKQIGLFLLASFLHCEEIAQEGDAKWIDRWSSLLTKGFNVKDLPQILRDLSGVAATKKLEPAASSSAAEAKQPFNTLFSDALQAAFAAPSETGAKAQ